MTIKSDDILRHIERLPNQSAGYKQLVRELEVRGSDQRRELADALHALVRSRRLLEIERDRFTLPAAAATRQNLVSGRLSMHRDGYGFVLPDDKILRDKISGDIYIPPPATLNAMHGDRVLVEIGAIRPDGSGRAEGRIVRIAERRHMFVVGKFHSRGGQNYIDPMDEKIGQVVIIPSGNETPAKDRASDARYGRSTAHRVIGDQTSVREYPSLENVVVNVEITDFPAGQGNPKGRVVEILGYEDEFGVDVEIIIRKHHLPHVFLDDALAEARELAADEAGFQVEVETRTDFRHLPIVTIDGETARDFDDAVMVRRKENSNYELQVHIADVAQYVTPFSALDDEARLRGNSVYFPDRAIPMLPLELSTDLCSLRPQLDRLVMSCIMEVDHQGGIVGYELHEGVIRSAARMTYTKVQAILDGDPPAQQEYAALLPEFKRMEELASILNRKRRQRGAIDFDLPEPVIDFDQQGMMQGVTRSERKFANRLIEEFMLAANECVAEYLEQRNIASIYRIHEKPDPKKVFEFEVLATSFGYSLGVGALPAKKIQLHADRREQQRRGNRRIQPKTIELPQEVHITPRMYQTLTEKIAGKPEERILSYLMLRSLKQARYSEKNEGHFALAAPTYTHFTSPIRRYPDLIIHRLLKAVLRGEVAPAPSPGPPANSARWGGSPVVVWTPSSAGHKRVDPHLQVGDKQRYEKAALAAGGKRQKLIEIIPEDELHEIAEHSSETERAAADAERELIEWKKAQFMVQHIGDEYEGLIVSITKFGMFVELMDLFVEGLVPLDTMQHDRFRFHENTRQMVGERWGTMYSMGDRVRVIVDRVDIGSHKINFSLVEETKELTRGTEKKKARKQSARPEAVQARASKKGRKEAPRKGKKRE